MLRAVLVSLAAGVVLWGCGSSHSSESSSAITNGKGDAAVFSIDARTIDVRQSGTASIHLTDAPEVDHDGPVGCAGRYFDTHFVAGAPLLFRYGARDAYLLVGSDLYYLGEPPQRSGGQLVWDTTSNGHRIRVAVLCEPPTDTGRLAVGKTPPACAVLTPQIAHDALGEKPGPPKFVFENPELSACQIHSVNTSFGHDRRMQVMIGSADEIKSLSSWAQPAISGIGDEAHGDDAFIGVAAVKGKLGVEVVVDLDDPAHPQPSLAKERQIARLLLARVT